MGIDERRAKFRQDLIDKIDVEEIARQRTWKADKRNKKKGRGTGNNKNGLRSFSSTSVNKIPESTDSSLKKFANGYPIFSNFINSDETPEPKSPAESVVSFNILMDHDSDSEDDEEHREQDIDEVWFPGGHGDIGGGWDLPDDEVPLSHGPLVWMVCSRLLLLIPLCQI